ncbi:MAG: hypothetical protein K2P78_10850, partial [Gemmataceae bacterium]|nr:hypothetical protein [Gemmataceae bacterium]
MRWYILRALLAKEFQRHLANRGGIALALLLVAAAVLLSVFAPQEAAAGGTGMVGGVHHCFVEFDRPTPLVKHLQANVPPDLKEQVRFRELPNPDRVQAVQNAEVGTGSIQLLQAVPEQSPSGRATVTVRVWHPKDDPGALAPYEQWLWKEMRRFYAADARKKQPGVEPPADPAFDANNNWVVLEAHARFQEQAAKGGAAPVPDLVIDRRGLGGKVLDFRAAIATGMVVFALYFSCVYLLPTLNCEERERGVLL